MTPPDSSEWVLQLVWLFVLAIPIACVAWTVTHEEVFREPREYCAERAANDPRLGVRKFFYLFTCEYCFSHYVTLFFLVLTRYRLLLDGWRGYLIAFFALVAIANVYMSAFGRLRQEVKSEQLDAKRKEKVLEKIEQQENGGQDEEPRPATAQGERGERREEPGWTSAPLRPRGRRS